MAPRGNLSLTVLRGGLALAEPKPLSLVGVFERGFPYQALPPEVRAYRSRNLFNLLRGLRRVVLAHGLGLSNLCGSLELLVVDGLTGKRTDLGLVSLRVVTTVFVNALVDALDAGVGATINNYNYHALGTGTNAENASDTALQTELTTEYVSNQRGAGAQTQPSANIYRTTATVTLDSGTPAVTEHGVFNQQATGGGTLMDRSVFSAINLVGANGDAIQATYSLTLTAGS